MGKGKTSAKANPFEIDERGKLVIVEKEGEGGGEEGGRRTAGEEEAMEVERKVSGLLAHINPMNACCEVHILCWEGGRGGGRGVYLKV